MSNGMHRGMLPGLLALAVVASGCGELAQQGRGPSQATVAQLEAAPGVKPSDLGGTLASDVITNVKRTVNGVEVRVPTVFGDPGRVTMTVAMKDASITAPTDNNAVTFTRYRVVYRRTDGRNTPGVDVPYAFDGAATFTVSPGGEAKVPFELVRIQAKFEAPLAQLTTGGSPAIAISTIAEVTFYGHDQTGREVQVTGMIGVDFANWADPES